MAFTGKVWPWIPQINMTESLEWKTDIIASSDGSEQRIGARDLPRQSFDVEVVVDDASELSMMIMAISYGQGLEWGWPCWNEQQKLGATLSAGSGSIAIDTTNSDYRNGGYAILWDSSDRYEVVDISTVADASLTLAGNTVNAFTASTLIMPLRTAHISESIERYDHPTTRQKLSLTISCTNSVDLSGAASATQYSSQDVIDGPLLMSGDTVKRTINRSLWKLDPEIGPTFITTHDDYPVMTSEHFWRLDSAAGVWSFREWLHRRRGRLVPVWIPTWQHDFVAVGEVASGSADITVFDSLWRIHGVDQPTKQHIALIKPDGTFVCRQIVSAVAGDAGEEVLTIDSAPGISGVTMISFLTLHRFAADRIELNWERVGVAECKASMVEVAA